MQTITIQFEDNEGDAVSIGIDELVRSGVPLDDNGNSKKTRVSYPVRPYRGKRRDRGNVLKKKTGASAPVFQTTSFKIIE